MIFLKDPKTGEPSVTLTLLILGFIVCTAKLLCSGVDIGVLKLSEFTGVDYAAAIGALGGVYTWRKGQDSKDKE